jgi:hypothetical protein
MNPGNAVTFPLPVTAGCIENGVYKQYGLEKQWIARVGRDPSKPGGLSREFFQRVGKLAARLPADLQPGQVIEMASDDRVQNRYARRNRAYYQVISIGVSSLEVVLLSVEDVKAGNLPAVAFEVNPQREAVRATLAAIASVDHTVVTADELRALAEALRDAANILDGKTDAAEPVKAAESAEATSAATAAAEDDNDDNAWAQQLLVSALEAGCEPTPKALSDRTGLPLEFVKQVLTEVSA